MADVSSAIDKMFDQIDADHSGSICKGEMDVAFKLFDTDGKEEVAYSKYSMRRPTGAYYEVDGRGHRRLFNASICQYVLYV